ncbi:MAG: helicase HerA-like domain-containing protein, partial [Candidatus Limnocylindrales bacterium]
MDQAFRDAITAGYTLGEPSIVLGSAMHEGELFNDTRVQVALSMLNRHGLIAGATGTGKTKTLQVMAGQLSDAGVPVFVSDIKGDVTGIAAPGTMSPRLQERIDSMGLTFQPSGHPVEFLSLTAKLGSQVRATVHSFGPLLLGKVLDLNETQTSILSLIFKYCDDNDLPLLDLKDLATTLKFLGSDEGKPILADYGGMSSASVGVLLRSIVVLEQEGADVFFGEPEFDVDDLLRTDADGKGIISILELSDVMDQPRLFSTFMLWMLAQLYEQLPEAGDLPKPKLCFFFDEAHLLFSDASDALLDQIERTARLIRSKGVGVYFVTQVPADVPSSVLAQLGNRVQHALRAFTPDDADNLRKAARTFPTTDFYDVEKTLTSLGTGEALVTVLSPKGIPTPLAATRLLPPDSLMAPVDEVVFRGMIAMSPLQARYGATVDRDSAHERITTRIASARAASVAAAQEAAVRAGVDPTTA